MRAIKDIRSLRSLPKQLMVPSYKAVALRNNGMNKTGYCQLCGGKVEDFEATPHVYCVQYETTLSDGSIIRLLKNGDEASEMTRKRGGLYVWVTWLSRLMPGETCCQWAPWFKTHHTDYEKVPSDFQSAIWAAEHTKMVDELGKEHLALGKKVFREGQNSFTLRRSSGLLVAGKPDLVTIDSAGQHTVYDAKTGNQNNSHTIQVMLYMMLLPHARPSYKGKEFAGCVAYKDGQRFDIPAAAIDDDFKKQATYFLDILESPTPPMATPSFAECRFCDIAESDCSTRCQTNIPQTIDGAEPNIPF